MRAALTAVALTLGFLPLMGGVAHAVHGGSHFLVDDVTVSETAGTATFTVSRTGVTTEPASVTATTTPVVDGATPDVDYTTTGPTVVEFAADVTTATFTVPIINDADDEDRIEKFNVTLTLPSPGDEIRDDTGVGQIVDDEGAVQLSVQGGRVTEGDAGTVGLGFTVIRSGPTTDAASATFSTTDGTATAGADYEAVIDEAVTVAAGAITATATVLVIGDTLDELDETFTVALSDPDPDNPPAVVGSGATGTIVDNDVAEDSSQLAISDATVIEGDPGDTNTLVFTVTRTGGTTTAGATFTIGAAGDTATAGVDYDDTTTTGTVTFPDADTTSQTIIVPVLADLTPEADETVTVTLSDATGSAVIQDSEAIGTIENDDSEPSSLSISDVTLAEGDAGTTDFVFTVTRTGGTTDAGATVTTSDGTAEAGTDYLFTSGTVSFTGDQTTDTFTVSVVGDLVLEADETFTVTLSDPTGSAVIEDAEGTATIEDDDFSHLAITDESVTEGDTGNTDMVFTVTRTGGTTTATATYTITEGTATAGEDYDDATTTGIVTFLNDDDTSQPITVPVIGDELAEGDETFTVTLSDAAGSAAIDDGEGTGTIVDDDVSRLSIEDVSVIEGDAGDTTDAVFTVTRAGATAGDAAATFTITEGTATAGEDYDDTTTTGTVAFAAGETSKTITVPVLGDIESEADETFIVTLSEDAVSVVLDDAEGTGTIVDDDVVVSSFSIDDISVTEGDSGTTNAVFTVTRSGATGDASATFATADSTAVAGSDYTATTGTVTFTGTEATKTVSVPVIGDTLDEQNEVFILSLSDSEGVVAEATGTIVDDDAAAVQTAGVQGYSLVASDGGIFTFGNSKFFGSTGAIRLNQPVVGMDHTPTTQGYWLVAADGGIFAFGDAKFFGSTGAIKLNKPIVGMRSTPTGNGYWLVASDGGIFAFGDAKFFGSTGAIRLNQPIVGMERTPTGNGYWLVASDGGIFAFGDAKFFGSTGAIRLNLPVVGMARTNTGDGYFLVASDGGIFAFGDAVFRGSTGAIRLNSPVTGMMPTATGTGYWLCARDGGVFAFGNAQFLGSMGATRLNQPVVGCDAPLSQSEFG